jgi:hypothetical protein
VAEGAESGSGPTGGAATTDEAPAAGVEAGGEGEPEREVAAAQRRSAGTVGSGGGE